MVENSIKIEMEKIVIGSSLTSIHLLLHNKQVYKPTIERTVLYQLKYFQLRLDIGRDMYQVSFIKLVDKFSHS